MMQDMSLHEGAAVCRDAEQKRWLKPFRRRADVLLAQWMWLLSSELTAQVSAWWQMAG